MDSEDSNDNNPFECSDVDQDNCDDCLNGFFNPSDDACTALGDINADGYINVLDIVQSVNLILTNQYNQNGDMNSDGTINILDIVALVAIIIP